MPQVKFTEDHETATHCYKRGQVIECSDAQLEQFTLAECIECEPEKPVVKKPPITKKKAK